MSILEILSIILGNLDIFLAVTDNEEVDGREQTVYACSGSPLVLRCGENETNHLEQVNFLIFFT